MGVFGTAVLNAREISPRTGGYFGARNWMEIVEEIDTSGDCLTDVDTTLCEFGSIT